MRIYPDIFPIIDNEATTDTVEITHSDSHGEGLKTKVNLKKGDLVFSFTGVALPYQNLFTLEFKNDMFIYDPYVMGKVLHSCDPNMRCAMRERTFYAKRDISAGEYLTMDYEETESKLYRPFDCQCDTAGCRGYISGKVKGGTRWKQD